MAKQHGKVWKPPYERYTVRFYNLEWDEVTELAQGPVSAVGVCRVLLDFTNEREFLKQNVDVALSRYRETPYVSVEVSNGQE